MADVEVGPDANHLVDFMQEHDEDLIDYDTDQENHDNIETGALWPQGNKDTTNPDLDAKDVGDENNVASIVEDSADDLQDEREFDLETEQQFDQNLAVESEYQDTEHLDDAIQNNGSVAVDLLEDRDGEEAGDSEVQSERGDLGAHKDEAQNEHSEGIEDAIEAENSNQDYFDNEAGRDKPEHRGAETLDTQNINDASEMTTTVQEDEITWEDGEATVDEANEPDDGVIDVEGQTSTLGADDALKSPAQHTSDEHGQDADHSLEAPQYVEEMHEENEMLEYEHQDVSIGTGEENQEASYHDPSDNEEHDFPAITVQYKGGEFPFFSGASEGFFPDLSVLDYSMESLMAGFRSELSNEIASDEELVFQVDEIGLEFAESSLRDTQSITMRQILEVFDLLVKNQDPDKSRVLYTYLFTKTSTSKRFESLMESATAGRGLDEVIHLFEPPLPQGATLDADIIEIDEHSDAYQSQQNDEETGERDVDSTTSAGANVIDENDLNEHDGLFDDAAVNGIEITQSAEISETTHIGNIEVDAADISVAEMQDSTLVASEEFTETVNTGIDVDQNGVLSPGASNSDAADQDNADTAIVETVDIGTSLQDSVHIDAVDDTLDHHASMEISSADQDIDLLADQVVLPEIFERDELAEIDWRDDPSVFDAAALETPGGEKRPRAEDELGTEDSQDAKRQRS